MQEEFDNLTLAKKIVANCCWPVYVPNYFFFSSPEMAEEITKKAKKQMRKALVNWKSEIQKRKLKNVVL